MPWLAPSILLSFGFGQLFKWAQRRGCHAPTVVSANYLTLAAVLAAYFLLRGPLDFPAAVLRVGLTTGGVFIFSMLLMTRALEIAGVAGVLTSFRLAILVPVAASVWLWSEEVSGRQIAGGALTLAALALMTRGGAWRGARGGAPALLLLVFFSQGASQTCLRWVHHAGLDGRLLQVLLVTALSAGLAGALFVVLQRTPPRGADLAVGAGIGLFNLAALAVILTALSQIAGAIFFPVQGCAVVILDNLCAHFFWKEPLSSAAQWGAGLGAGAMLMVL